MWYEVWTYVEQIPGNWMSRLCYAVSKDGIHWSSVDTPRGIIMPGDTDTQHAAFYDPNIKKYEAYVRPNPNAKRVGDQIAYAAYMGPGMARVKDELWMYGIEEDVPHDNPWYGKHCPSGIHRYVQCLDGFISLDARDRQGTVTTKTFVLRGNNLEINADADLAQSPSKGSMLAVDVPDN